MFCHLSLFFVSSSPLRALHRANDKAMKINILLARRGKHLLVGGDGVGESASCQEEGPPGNHS